MRPPGSSSWEGRLVVGAEEDAEGTGAEEASLPDDSAGAAIGGEES